MTETATSSSADDSAPIGVAAQIHSVDWDKAGAVRFGLLLRLRDGSEISITGFRYYPETDELKPPCYRVGKGWQPIVKLSGPMLEELREEVRWLAQEIAGAHEGQTK